jgi:hypothetical protein
MQKQKIHSPTSGNSHTSQVMDTVKDTASYPMEEAPITTTLLVFGVGLGLGALIGSMIAEASAPQTRVSQAEAVGRSILDSFSSAVPSSIRKHMP